MVNVSEYALGYDFSKGSDRGAIAVMKALGDGTSQLVWQVILTGSCRQLAIWKRLWTRTRVVDRGYATPCFEWAGPTSGNGKGGGYGRMCLNDTTCATHKVGWTNQHGYIPHGKQLDHLCENRLCWREDHLELVSHKRNQTRRATRRKAA